MFFFIAKGVISHVGVMLINTLASLVCKAFTNFRYLYTRLGV